MSKITQTKLIRAEWRIGRKWGTKLQKNGSITKAMISISRIKGYKPAKERELVTCKCERSKFLSVGQVWKCYHGLEGRDRKKHNVREIN